MGAVNFSLDKNFILELKKVIPLDVLVETGTFEGTTVLNMQTVFKQIHSTEISEEYYERALAMFSKKEHIKLYRMESPDFIKLISDEIKQESTVYWLDAHWMVADFAAGDKSQCPLLEEIKNIGKLNDQSIIMIDDARLFLTTPPYPHEITHWPSLNSVLLELRSLSSNHKIMVLNDTILFFPNHVESIVNNYAYRNSINWLDVLHKNRDYDNLKIQFGKLEQVSEQLLLRLDAGQMKQKESLLKSLHKFASLLRSELASRNISYTTQYELLPNEKLSIVIPTFNQGNFIKDCLDSILNQTYLDLEIIIQDSMSTDETGNICREYAKKDKRIQYYREKDAGQSDAINIGLEKSTGGYWTWICSDDRYSDNNAIESLMKEFQTVNLESNDFVGVYGDANFIFEDGKYSHEYGNEEKDLVKDDFLSKWPLSQPSSILLTSKVKAVQGVKKELFLGMDLDLFLKMLADGQKFRYVKYKIVEIRLQDNSKSVKYRKDTALNALQLINQYFGSLGNLNHSNYFGELKASSTEAEIQKYLSEYKFYYKLKYKIDYLLKPFDFIILPIKKFISRVIYRIKAPFIKIIHQFPKLHSIILRVKKKLRMSL